MTASEDTDLPDPDSPTMPSTSPGCTWYDSPRTAVTGPASLGKVTDRSVTSSRGSVIGRRQQARSSGAPRVQGVAQAVADQVHRQQQRDEHTGGEVELPRVRQGGR